MRNYRTRSPLRALLLALLLVLPLAACGSEPAPAAGPPVGIDALPAGIGRGYPVVSVERGYGGVVAGDPAPPFALTLDDGRTLALEDLRGRPVLINHWATWCGPCRLEMPEITAAAAAHPELVVLAVNLMQARSQIEPFAEEYGLDFPVVVDPEGKLRDLYGVRGLPTTFLIDREGRIAAVWAGVLTADALDDLLAKVL